MANDKVSHNIRRAGYSPTGSPQYEYRFGFPYDMSPKTVDALQGFISSKTKKQVATQIIDQLVAHFRFELETIFDEKMIERVKQPLPYDTSEE